MWFYFLILFARHFLSGIIVKDLDSVVKQIASNFSLFVTFFALILFSSIETGKDENGVVQYMIHGERRTIFNMSS